MKLFSPLSRTRGSRVLAACALLLAIISVGIVCSSAQDAQPDPTPNDTPVASPVPALTGTPQITITPGMPGAADMVAYNAARTPQVNIILSAATASPGSATSAIGANTNAVVQRAATTSAPLVVKGGASMLTTLQAPSAKPSKTSRATASTTGANAQPVAVVVLTYAPSCAGQLVWVQMLGGGTLTADDGAGHTYDGSKGFYLTLDANGMATFNYQAPNASGTYQVLTRFTNVITALPFLVPDPAP